MTTDFRSFYTGRFLSAPDLVQDSTMTIDQAYEEMVDTPDGKTRERKLLVTFKEDWAKGWLPCKTASTCVGALYGNAIEGWAGKSITLFHDTEVMFGREKVGGIRVRGAPGARPMTVAIKHPRKKTVNLRLVDTGGGQRQKQAPPQSQPKQSLAEVLEGEGLTPDDLDVWLAQQGKTLFGDMDNSQKQKAADWLCASPQRLTDVGNAGRNNTGDES